MKEQGRIIKIEDNCEKIIISNLSIGKRLIALFFGSVTTVLHKNKAKNKKDRIIKPDEFGGL